MARLSKEQQAEVRKKIIKESKELFLEKGYDKTSTSAIAKRVGVAEGTLFNYFPSKLEIIVEAITEEFQFNESIGVDDIKLGEIASEIIYNFLRTVYKPILNFPKFMIVEIGTLCVQLGKKNPTLLRKLVEIDFHYIDQMKDLIGKLKTNGLLVPEVDASYLSEAIFSAFMYDLVMYGYDKRISKDDLWKNLKERIHFTCSGFLPR